MSPFSNALIESLSKVLDDCGSALLKGCFAAARNPIAHEPKVMWKGEDDAADYFTLISLLHRKLDDCVPTGMGCGR